MANTIESFNKSIREAVKSLDGELITNVEIGWEHGSIQIHPQAKGYKIFNEENEDITPKSIDPLVELNDLVNYFKSQNLNEAWLKSLMYSLFEKDPVFLKKDKVVKIDDDERKRFAYGFIDLLEAAKVLVEHYDNITK